MLLKGSGGGNYIKTLCASKFSSGLLSNQNSSQSPDMAYQAPGKLLLFLPSSLCSHHTGRRASPRGFAWNALPGESCAATSFISFRCHLHVILWERPFTSIQRKQYVPPPLPPTPHSCLCCSTLHLSQSVVCLFGSVEAS